MKAVLMSIQPQLCELIATGKKRVDVRKTRPKKLETPFKVYIYCTKDNTFAEKTLRGFDNNGKAIYHKANKGKVIGEFICDEILVSFLNNNDALFKEEGLLTQKEIYEYQGNKAILYGWHISDIVIYDKPKDLSEFYIVKEIGGYEEFRQLSRPPQSWCYVEELKGE